VKLEAVGFSETSVSTSNTARRIRPKDRRLNRTCSSVWCTVCTVLLAEDEVGLADEKCIWNFSATVLMEETT